MGETEQDEVDRMHVLDANVFIHGASRQLPEEFSNPVTVPAVTAELESDAAGRRFDVEDIPVYAPADDAVATVEDAAADRGDDLSDTDIQVVALALERDAVVVSDDYGVQNVAAALDVTYTGFLQGEITEEIQWTYRCTNCGETVELEEANCPVCGGALTKVPDRD
jgi:UPF0271 protein